MAFLALAYPQISEKDYAWIQAYRKENDPRYFSVVEPHFTLVFAVEDISQEEFVKEIKEQLAGFPAFMFDINVATINQDDSGEYYHEFLVPDKGYSNIVKLHDKLYSDLLKNHLKFDIDFIPHIGIGNSDLVSESKKRIDELNKNGVSISGSVIDVDVVEYKEGKVKTLEKIKLT